MIQDVEDETPPSSQVKVKLNKTKRVKGTVGRFKCKSCTYATNHKNDFAKYVPRYCSYFVVSYHL